MKHTAHTSLSLLLLLLLSLSLTACFGLEAPETTATPSVTGNASTQETLPALWQGSLYQKNTALGEGEDTLTLTISAGEKSIVITLAFDAQEELDLGTLLVREGLLEGEDGPYGLYIKRVNGILADYNIDQTYWSFSVNGKTAMHGVSAEIPGDGAVYSLVRAK